MTSEAEARGLDEDGVTRVEGRVLAERVRGPAMEGIVAREQRELSRTLPSRNFHA